MPDPAVPPVKQKKQVDWMRGGKFRPGPAMRAAIFEVLAKQASGWPAGYEEVAKRHGVKANSLCRLVSRYRKGGVDLGDQKSLEEKVVAKQEVSLQAELMRRQALLADYEKHLDDVFVKQLKRSKTEAEDGNLLAFDQLGMPKIIEQMSKSNVLRRKLEKGVLELLEQLQAAADRRKQMIEPQQAKGTVILERPTQASHIAAAATDHQKIREALTATPAE